MKQDLNKMMCLDLYLSGSKNNAETTTEAYPNEDDAKILPLISWDVFNENYFQQLIDAKKAMDLKKSRRLQSIMAGKTTSTAFLKPMILKL